MYNGYDFDEKIENHTDNSMLYQVYMKCQRTTTTAKLLITGKQQKIVINIFFTASSKFYKQFSQLTGA